MDSSHEARSRLLRRRAELVGHDVTTRQGSGDQRASSPAERASSRGAAGVIEFLSEVELLELGQIDAALARLDRGSYGVCSACGQPIDARRLRALPQTAVCGSCAR